jgi:BASS family bile acid:Na+ symporter
MPQRFLLVGLVVSSLIAFFWPEDEPNPFVRSAPYLSWLIAATMFVVGCLLPAAEFRGVGRRWPLVLAGTAIQYTAMPLLAFAVGQAFAFEPGLMAGVILVGCVPGAMASNVLTLFARGNTSYSVCLTTLATLLSPIAVPLALWLTLSAEHQLDFVKVAWSLVWQVVLPMLAGFGLCRLSARVERLAAVVGPWVANVTILWIIAAVVAINRNQLHEITPGVLVALLLINGLGYLAGYGGGLGFRLDEPMRRALTLEVGMQNCGLGTTLALALFPGTQAAIPTAAYTFGCMLTGTLLATWWSRRPVDAPEIATAPLVVESVHESA